MMNYTMTGYFTFSGFSLREIIYHGSPYFVTLLALWILMEQITYLKKKSILPGPSLVLPFLGTVTPLIRNPTRYWVDQSSYAQKTPMGVSVNYIVGRFMVFIGNSELSHKILNNVRPDAFLLVIHPFGKKLFGEHNIIYKMGQEHKDLRRRMAPIFSPRALSVYVQAQQSIMVKHFLAWERLSGANKPIAIRTLARDMNIEASQTVFTGPYLSSQAREEFNQEYNLFNLGVMKLPIDLPGFGFRAARLAVRNLCETLSVCAAKSKERIYSGAEPTCLVDFWMQEARREELEASEEGVAPSPPLPSCKEIGGHLFDFLFAAQDASTSSLLWAVTYLESHPDILSKVRDEVAGIWSPESHELITAEQLMEMKYTNAVAREVLRIRAPATLVPHIAAADFPLTKSYTIPKGSLVFPSVLESSFQGFSDPERFDPDRFLEGREEDKVYKRNFLVFGSGPHQCVGQRYAFNTLVLFIAMFTTMLDFKRHRTNGCDEIVYVPTICPKDDCMVFLSRRVVE